jgi:Tfp pilus assembly PilM family ATPase
MINKKTKCVGLIIKDQSLSAVEVENGKNGPVVTNYSKILLEEGIVENGCIILNKEGFQEGISKLLANAVGGPINTDSILVSVPEEKIFSHQIEISKEKLKDVECVKEAARDFIPIELNRAVFDYRIAHENPEQKTVTLNFVATQNSVAEPIIEALKEIKIDVTEMNVDINCIIKSFHNSLNQSEGAFLVANMKLERDLLAINSADDSISKIISKGERGEITEKLKALLNLSSNEEVQQLLLGIRQGTELSEEQKTSIKNSFKPYLDDLANKVRKLVSAAQTDKSLEIKVIYLTGILSALPGVEETIANLLPGVPVKKTVQYTEIPPEIEGDALEGIGLCIDGLLPNDKNNFNLLPQAKKDEINISAITPKLQIVSTILAMLFMALTIVTGIQTAKSYLTYKISSQEVVILNQQALNPYATQIAKIKQQMKQDNAQILSLLNDAVPVSLIIQDLDSYNRNGVTMVNISYNDMISGPSSDISLRAKTVNRNETEKFVAQLEEDQFYSEVESPLSNLVGKGERFVNIGLIADKADVIEAFENPTDIPLSEDEDDD